MKRWAMLAVFVSELFDMITSSIPGGLEGNPFARDPGYKILIGHLLTLKIVYDSVYFVLGYLIYSQVRRLSQKVADLLVVLFCVYLAYHMGEIAFQNLLLALGWYQG